MPNSKQIVYLSQTQYAELIANGTITVDGVTVNYDENDIYVTPQAEPVTDVRMNNASITSNGIANIPLVVNRGTAGIVKVNQSLGVTEALGTLTLTEPNASTMKESENGYYAISPKHQHEAAFYGLAKAAGHDEASSTEPLGTYTPEAKGAIQSMLGVSDLIATAENNLVASKAYAIGDVFTANGKLYKATAAIAADGAIITDGASANCEETNVGEGFVKFTDYATGFTAGVVRIGAGLQMAADGERLYTKPATSSVIKRADDTYVPIDPAHQHEAAFYGLAKAAGADEKDSTLPVGEYTDTAKSAIRTMIGATSNNVIAVQDTQPANSDTKIWLPETAETPVEVPTMADMNAALATKMSAIFEEDGLVITSAAGFAEGGIF